MSHAWIVVADAARARIFSAESPIAPLVPLEQFVCPQARLHERDMASDRPGRSFDSTGAGRHGTDAPTSPKEHEAVRFAKTVAEYLERGRVDNSYNCLILVAEPHFLGLIRKAIKPETAKMVTNEIDKDLSKFDRKDISEHLSKLLGIEPT